MIVKKHKQDFALDTLKEAPKETFSTEPLSTWGSQVKTTRVCQCCKSVRNPDAFTKIADPTFGFIDPEGRPRAMYCKKCLKYILDALIKQEPDHDEYKSLYRLCAMMNLYYSDEIAHRLHDEDNVYDVDGQKVSPYLTWVDLYCRYIEDDPEMSQKTFFGSECVDIHHVAKAQKGQVSDDYFTEEDKRNRLQIITTFHRDVFEKDPLEERSALMTDLVTMIDDSMADDYVRQEAAIEIVRTFHRISKISAALQLLQKDAVSTANNAKVIKELVDQKKKETDMVTAFSKDHGFAEKYALSKSRGAGTLGAIVRDMNEKGYDKGAVNKFDIETARAMQQVSDISAESIFKQISLADSDYADMVKEQAGIIRSLREIMERQAEELRILREKHLKQELLDEYRNDLRDKDIDEAEIDALVEDELMNPTEFKYRAR